MAQTQQKTKQTSQKTVAQKQSSYSAVLERLNDILGQYACLPMDNLYSAFGRAFSGWANNAPLQNSRVKAISTLPADIDKTSLGEFLRYPQNSERPLRQVAEGLKWSAYSFFKLQKSYADILQFHHYALPQYVTASDIKTDSFQREYRLVDKLLKKADMPSIGHQVAAEALVNGKVFYVPRFRVDKSHNSIDYVMFQRLPQNYVIIEGFNNISKYTLAFDLTYFLNPATDYRQFGDLFEPFMADFDKWVSSPISERQSFRKKAKYVYASRNNEEVEAEVKAWYQNGRYMYFVSLPIDRVWTFEIDESSSIVASPFSGLMQTFAQQADYEAAQLSLILNPLIKIFTGEIPYYQSTGAKEDDGFRLSLGARALFEAYFNDLMARNNTGGTALYTAPVQNLKSHDYPESSNANAISQSYLNYGMSKSGTTALIPTTDNPHQGISEYSAKLESKFAQGIYRTLEKMFGYILSSLNLNHEYSVRIFGDIYSDNETRANALKELNNGDTSAFFVLAALNGESVLDKIAMCDIVDGLGLLDRLTPPQTAYTQSGKSEPKSTTGGAPTKTKTEVQDTKIEKQTESATE